MNLDDMYSQSQLDAARVDLMEREAAALSPAWESSEVCHTSTTGGQKGIKPQRFELLPPGALAQVAEVYHYGASKYADHNWRKGYKWSWSLGALLRHVYLFMAGQDKDEESGLSHMAHACFHCLTLLTFSSKVQYQEHDDRYKENEST